MKKKTIYLILGVMAVAIVIGSRIYASNRMSSTGTLGDEIISVGNVSDKKEDKKESTKSGQHKIELQPGEMKKVVFKLKGSDLAFVGYDKKWRLEKGRFRMKCGSEVLYINCEKDKIWNTPNIN